MSKLAAQLIILNSIVKFLLAQSAATIADRIVWERDFSNLAVSTTGAAVADRDGNLWAVSEYRSSDRLICIRPDGTMVMSAELPKEIKPTPPSDVSYFSLESAPSGGQYRMAGLPDGYVLAISAETGLFLAKYTLTGRLLWSATDPSRSPATVVVASGDGYYLIGAGLKDRYSLHVIRAH